MVYIYMKPFYRFHDILYKPSSLTIRFSDLTAIEHLPLNYGCALEEATRPDLPHHPQGSG